MKEKIFDPFFTTKALGEGTGIGLSVVHGVVKSHKGGVEVESKLGVGTLFRIYLPSSDIHPMSSTLTQPLAAKEQTSLRDIKILLVDDEVEIATLLKELLAAQGSRVLFAQSPIEALDILKETGKDIELVISDQNMPGMLGLEMLREMKKIRPNIRTVLISGFINGSLTKEAAGVGLDKVLTKPLDPSEILLAIGEVMNFTTNRLTHQDQPLTQDGPSAF